jgi:hypothetical protein
MVKTYRNENVSFASRQYKISMFSQSLKLSTTLKFEQNAYDNCVRTLRCKHQQENCKRMPISKYHWTSKGVYIFAFGHTLTQMKCTLKSKSECCAQKVKLRSWKCLTFWESTGICFFFNTHLTLYTKFSWITSLN